MIDAQPRVILASTLFRLAVSRAAAALAPRKLAPETKERMLALLEEGVWDLPSETFADPAGEDAWLAAEPVKRLLERAVARGTGAQP